jgi:hypothetical protein
MSNKYSYLRSYIPKKYPKLYSKDPSAKSWNLFGPVIENDVKQAEEIMGINFPLELREFYNEIGDGYLTTPYSADQNYRFSGGSNEVLPPLVAAHFYRGIIAYHEEPFEDALNYGENYLSNEILDILEPGDLPFFEIGDSSRFMVLKTKSDNPNAVWYLGFEKIEDSFEQFIWNLYYKNPRYYVDKL